MVNDFGNTNSLHLENNVLSHGIEIWIDFSSVLSQCTRLTDGQTDGLTDRILIARPRLHSMQRSNKLEVLEISVSVSRFVETDLKHSGSVAWSMDVAKS